MIESACHCGAVRLRLEAAPASVTDCNCALCRKLGVLWAYYPPAEVSEASAADATEVYLSGRRTIAVHRCRTCGCVVCWRGLDEEHADRVGVNARLLPPEILAGAKVRRLDGAGTERYLDEP